MHLLMYDEALSSSEGEAGGGASSDCGGAEPVTE